VKTQTLTVTYLMVKVSKASWELNVLEPNALISQIAWVPQFLFV